MLAAILVLTSLTSPPPPAMPTWVPTPAPIVAPTDLTGKWRFTMVTSVGTFVLQLDMTQRGDSLRGTITSTLGPGKITGGRVQDEALTIDLELTVGGTPYALRATGRLTALGDRPDYAEGSGDSPQYGPWTWTAERAR